MEPAGHQREHQMAIREPSINVLPQWSPPVSDGSTSQPSTGFGRTTAYRNGGRRREHMTILGRPVIFTEPQWSPPLTGGSTCRQLGWVAFRGIAAPGNSGSVFSTA